jgi:purine nucleosidase
VAGRNDALAYGPGQPWVPQYEAIEHLPHRRDYGENQAVDFLRKTIRSRPGEIVLLTIAPLPNIALLFALDPEIPYLLKGVVSMAGAFFGYDNHEWNCICDPAATAMTVRTPRPNHFWYGLDVTMQVTQTPDQVRERYVTEPLQTILPMAEIWFRRTQSIVYHDPLAAACLFEPELCAYKTGKITVDPAVGRTYFDEGDGTDRVAVSVDVDRFFEHFFAVVG